MAYYDEIKAKFSKSDEYVLYPDISKATLRLELSNICNHQCIFCLHNKMKQIRRQGEMKEELVYRLIKEYAEEGGQKIGLFMNGEPFISRNLPQYIKFCKESGIGYVFITTNGALANEENLKAVFDSGLDSIKFSINAGSRTTYQKVHGKDDFDKVFQNLKFAHEYRCKSNLNYKILASCVVTDEVLDELSAIHENIRPFVDDFVYFHAQNFSGESNREQAGLNTEFHTENAKDFVFERPIPCYYPFTHIAISYEGFLTVCNEDALNKMAMIDLNHTSMKDAWYSDKMIEVRKKHLEGQVEGIQCYNCSHGTDDEILPLNLELYQRGCL